MRTRKWLVLLGGITLVHVGWSLVGTVFDGVLDAGGLIFVLYLFGGLLGVLLTPVYFVALYLDAGVVRQSSSPWNPDRLLWVGGGMVFSLSMFALSTNPLIEIITVAYLVRRFRNPVRRRA